MPSITKAVEWVVKIANDPAHGYAQDKREGPDYDCSSLIATALNQAGFDIKTDSYTGNLYSRLTKIGFKKCTAPWQRGDIHLKVKQHVVMSISPDKIVHARSNEFGGIKNGKPGDQTGREIMVDDYYEINGGWDYHLRYNNRSTHNSTVKDVVDDVISGSWGSGSTRKHQLRSAGYNYHKVQLEVNKRLGVHGMREVAQDVIDGKYGSGVTRTLKLTAAGYDSKAVQRMVNQIYADGEDF